MAIAVTAGVVMAGAATAGAVTAAGSAAAAVGAAAVEAAAAAAAAAAEVRSGAVDMITTAADTAIMAVTIIDQIREAAAVPPNLDMGGILAGRRPKQPRRKGKPNKLRRRE